jgi:hypothetical protein
LPFGKFYRLNTALWIMAPVAGVVTLVLARWLLFPFLAAPFIGCCWLLGPIANSAGLNKIHLGAFPVEATSYFPVGMPARAEAEAEAAS